VTSTQPERATAATKVQDMVIPIGVQPDPNPRARLPYTLTAKWKDAELAFCNKAKCKGNAPSTVAWVLDDALPDGAYVVIVPKDPDSGILHPYQTALAQQLQRLDATGVQTPPLRALRGPKTTAGLTFFYWIRMFDAANVMIGELDPGVVIKDDNDPPGLYMY